MIRVRAEPAGGREFVHASLRASGSAAPDGGRWRVGRPLPSVRLSAASARKGSPLARARTVGWRYPLLGDGVEGLAHVLARRHGLVFVGVNGPALARRLFVAAEIAESELGPERTRYEPRLLEAAELRLMALWFFARNGKSRFVLLKGQPDESDVLSVGSDLARHLHAALDRLRR